MLGEDEKYILKHRIAQGAKTILKKAREGKDVSCDVNSTRLLSIKMCVEPEESYTEVESLRIFEGIFE